MVEWMRIFINLFYKGNKNIGIIVKIRILFWFDSDGRGIFLDVIKVRILKWRGYLI